MIRINRNPNPPTSLAKPEIAAYLDLVRAYRQQLRDFESGLLAVEPSAPAKPGPYRTSDLLDAFEQQFFCKCYLTEEKFDDGAELEVDHFVTQSDDDSLRYDWHNLFPISNLANKLRPKSVPECGYLDPCIDDVESEIEYLFIPLADHLQFEARDSTNLKAANTARLLNHLHLGSDERTERSTRGLRKAIQKQNAKIAELLARHSYPRDDFEKKEAAAMLRKYFSRESGFTMLMRNSPIGQRLRDFHLD